MPKSKSSATSSKYLHGYTKKEQDRLLSQAEFLEPFVYSGVNLEFLTNCLEVGSGVGAQTKILLRRFPKLKVQSIELSRDQISRAKVFLAAELKQKRVQILEGDATQFKLKQKFQSAFLCWFLEHVPDPLAALKNTFDHLEPGAVIYCSEVFNQTLFLDPYSPAAIKYWFEFNDLQWTIKGHPFVGAKLGHYLKEAGFTDIRTEVRPFHFDSRSPKIRSAFIDYFFQILLSAEKEMIKTGRVSKELVNEMHKEFEVVKRTQDSVFFYAYIHATARKP